MAKGKHTAGPWVTDPEVEHEAVLGADGKMVADCAIFGPGLSQKRNIANARLIAAAPELLEALRWAVNMAEEAVCCRRDSDDPEDHKILDHHEAELVKAKTILARATGAAQ
jgi:hypothetical protein